MEIKVTKQIGNSTYEFNISEKDTKEALNLAATLGSPPDYCDECKSKENFKLISNKDKKGNVYVNILCRMCGAKAKLGSYKTGGFFFYKFEKYQPNQKDQIQKEFDGEERIDAI